MPKEIQFHQYEAAYRVGLKHHDDPALGITAARQMMQPTGMDPNSAVALIFNVSHLLRGEVFKRAMSGVIVDSYLTWIRRDRESSAYANAIAALGKHIEYYEKKRNVRRPALRAVLAKHKALLLAPDETTIVLEWDDAASRGYFDILPLGLFAKMGVLKGVVHVTRRPRGKDYHAKCDLTVGVNYAELDYEPYAAFNDKNGMFNGVARLKFADTDRTALESVEWKSMGKVAFTDIPFRCPTYSVPPAPPFTPPAHRAKKRAQMVRERPGQAKFRRDLKSAYAQRCCITGCTVSEALEGAHIDPYRAPASDNLRNGLLLRRDVHAVYDKHLISIEPSSLTIRVAEGARGAGGYADLDGKKLRLPVGPSHHPDPGALERHWKAFQKKQLPD